MGNLYFRALLLFAVSALLHAPFALAGDNDGQKDQTQQAQEGGDEAVAGYDGPKENLHVYLLIGQSNMAGRAKVPEDMAGVIDRCYLLNDKNQWVPAKNPLNLYSSIRKAKGVQRLGPGYSFALAMLEANPDISIGLVVNARGGSMIEAWERKSKYYMQSGKRTQAAMQTGTLKGILWHQGESNSGSPEGYLDKLTTLVTDLRGDFEVKDLPFVAGQINSEPGRAINEQIAKLPETVAGTAMADSQGLTTLDRWHFDTQSQIELGKRYAKQMLMLQQQAEEQDEAKSR